MSKLITTTEAGRMLGITRPTVISLIEGGLLKAIRPGHEYRIRESSVLELIDKTERRKRQ